MKALILAAGLGKRMRPLTDHTPKPLLQVAGKPLIYYHLESLRHAGITDIVVNTAYLAEQLHTALGDGQQWGVNIAFSDEGQPLETGGAIQKALPLLGSEPFLLVNGDIWTDLDFSGLAAATLSDQQLGHLLMVKNPDHNPAGDFILGADTTLRERQDDEVGLTFSGISLLDPRLITHYPRRRAEFPLAECLRYAIGEKQLTGERFGGQWWDIGTPERLDALDSLLSTVSADVNV